jgi:hypothetical protein
MEGSVKNPVVKIAVFASVRTMDPKNWTTG